MTPEDEEGVEDFDEEDLEALEEATRPDPPSEPLAEALALMDAAETPEDKEEAEDALSAVLEAGREDIVARAADLVEVATTPAPLPAPVEEPAALDPLDVCLIRDELGGVPFPLERAKLLDLWRGRRVEYLGRTYPLDEVIGLTQASRFHSLDEVVRVFRDAQAKQGGTFFSTDYGRKP